MKKIRAIRAAIARHRASIVTLENELVAELAELDKDVEHMLSPGALFADRTRRLTNVLYSVPPGSFVSRGALLMAIFAGDRQMLERSLAQLHRDLGAVDMRVEYVDGRGYRMLWGRT